MSTCQEPLDERPRAVGSVNCPTTRAYVTRRTAQGKSSREIRRCLKRYITRQLYRTLTDAMTPTSA